MSPFVRMPHPLVRMPHPLVRMPHPLVRMPHPLVRPNPLSLPPGSLAIIPPRRTDAPQWPSPNFFITRPDGTTAAERFFGAAHDDLFELLCARLPPPARPRPRRVRFEEPTEATG